MAKNRPRSTSELGRLASIQVDSNTPIRLYFRSADLLIKQARVYKMEYDYEHAYVLYMKYTNLGLNELPKHQQYKTADYKKSRMIVRRNCMEALDALEVMKPKLDKEYKSYESHLLTEQQRRQTELEARHAQQLKNVMIPKAEDGEHTATLDDWSLQDALRGVVGVGGDDRPTDPSHTESTAHYPNVNFSNQSDGFTYQAQLPDATVVPPPPRPPKPQAAPHAPALPPKLALEPPLPPEAPPLPAKIKLEQPSPPPLPEPTSYPSSGVTTERGEPLRTLLVPGNLQDRFLSIAKPNTIKNIETCGILAGTLKNNVLKVTTLIIPKQTGTSDTCTTENEEELFEYQDANDLLTFGWIHTHPSQSCFLSSVDLHTHCSYQLMLPEAIAIVCAPKNKPDFGIFRLTDPPGLDVISSCKIERAFHPHPDLPIYTDTHHGSHVHTKSYALNVVDLR
ncbi:Mov34-domain-containing protein [Hesseltinella vesiculosa]|uniref:Mov34-domain-containing protein n=1 Tax=Hesseltinella vesiculosa TaxID=101127 RepID=A0A1X2G5J7_9FUNG|nr:Mov34-domain-containing protein [Hesseltinella vesiculosa]